MRGEAGADLMRYPRERTYLVVMPRLGIIGVRAANKKEARAKWLRAFKHEKMPRGTLILRGSIEGPVID